MKQCYKTSNISILVLRETMGSWAESSNSHFTLERIVILARRLRHAHSDEWMLSAITQPAAAVNDDDVYRAARNIHQRALPSARCTCACFLCMHSWRGHTIKPCTQPCNVQGHAALYVTGSGCCHGYHETPGWAYHAHATLRASLSVDFIAIGLSESSSGAGKLFKSSCELRQESAMWK